MKLFRTNFNQIVKAMQSVEVVYEAETAEAAREMFINGAVAKRRLIKTSDIYDIDVNDDFKFREVKVSPDAA